MPDRPAASRKRPIDREWLTHAYDEHVGGLYRYALVVLMDHALAEDAVQSVFTKLLSSGGTVPDAPDRYLRRAIRNECLSVRERRSRQQATSAQPVLSGGSAVDHSERMAIEAALRELPVDQREVIVLKVYEGMTFKEIADLTDVSADTVASRYRYALNKLRMLLDSSRSR